MAMPALMSTNPSTSGSTAVPIPNIIFAFDRVKTGAEITASLMRGCRETGRERRAFRQVRCQDGRFPPITFGRKEGEHRFTIKDNERRISRDHLEVQFEFDERPRVMLKVLGLGGVSLRESTRSPGQVLTEKDPGVELKVGQIIEFGSTMLWLEVLSIQLEAMRHFTELPFTVALVEMEGMDVPVRMPQETTS